MRTFARRESTRDTWSGCLLRGLRRGDALGDALAGETVPGDVVALAAALFVASARREGGVAVDAGAESRWAEAGRREGLRL